MDAWEVIDQMEGRNVLPPSWAFKCRGLIKKFKASFCTRGDKQIEGVDYFETFAPVVQWIAVRLMLILECLLNLVSKQRDTTCAILSAHLPEEEQVCVEMSLGFKQYD